MSKHDFPLATSTWDQSENNALRRVIESGHFTMADEVKKFEKAFAEFNGSKFAVMVNSGSSANLLMVAALFYVREGALRRGDEIIVPAVSWSTTYFPLCQHGLKIRLVDIDLHTLNYDLSALAEAITPRTKVIMAVNLLGNPNDFDEINSIIAGRNIRLIEDNCESLGAIYNGRMAGTFGEMGSFSTFFSHHISTMEGGVVITDNEELYHILLCLRAHGWTRDLPESNYVSGLKNVDRFAESWNFVLPGYNVRPLEMSGAVGLTQLAKLPSLLQGRRANAEAFEAEFGADDSILIQREIGESSWFGFSLIVLDHSNFDRLELVRALERKGIEVRPIVAGNFASKSVVKYFDYSVFGDLPNARLVDRSGLFIGNHHYDVTDMFDRVRDVLNELL